MSDQPQTYTFTTTVPPPDGWEYTGELAMFGDVDHRNFAAVLRRKPIPVSVSLPAETWRVVLMHGRTGPTENCSPMCKQARDAIEVALKASES